MPLDPELALETALSLGDEWQAWRALRLAGEERGPPVHPTYQNEDGGFAAGTGRSSPGATGEALCHLVVIGATRSPIADAGAAWLEDARTPALAWLDPPDHVPGPVDSPAAGRVWATAAAACGLLASGRDPGPRALMLVRGEADQDGRFTGGAYPTFAAAGALWLAEGAKSEAAEWALRWAREQDEARGPWDLVTGLTFWCAAGVEPDHASVDAFADELRDQGPPQGWPDDVELTLRALEVLSFVDAP